MPDDADIQTYSWVLSVTVADCSLLWIVKLDLKLMINKKKIPYKFMKSEDTSFL